MSISSCLRRILWPDYLQYIINGKSFSVQRYLPPGTSTEALPLDPTRWEPFPLPLEAKPKIRH